MDRSEIMRRVRSKDTTPELVVRRLIFSFGYRYRLHRRDLPGKPDIVIPSRKKIIFVHGCFWHGHACKRGARIPKQNRKYWEQKITRNKELDKKHRAELKRMGWRVQIVWECEIRNLKKLENRMVKFLSDSNA
ncbi:MAG: DNA mismatch endonuclease Vsr [Gammaproteobacteria bacterium]|nr:DNA mismatch endonuclease Vsr [Gammaproteobacteria bacterium]